MSDSQGGGLTRTLTATPAPDAALQALPPGPLTYQDLWSLVKHLPKVLTAAQQEAQLTPEQFTLKKLRITILGEMEHTRAIKGFSHELSKLFTIKAIDKYRFENLLQDCGPGIAKLVHSGRNDVDGMFKMDDVRRAIAIEGGRNRLSDSSHMGLGVWELNGRLGLIGAGELLIYNGHLETVQIPVIGGHVVDFSSGERWYDQGTIGRYIDAATRDPQWCQKVLDEATALFARWDNLRHPSVDPQMMAALVIATWLQTVWEWRPMVAVTGPTNSGKSMLLEMTLPQIFGSLALFNQKPTEAGLRQAVGNTARIIICDEFEADAHRQKVLELFRTSSRGGKVLRGTISQKGAAYGLRHIPWVGAIESGLRKTADRNRFILFELGEVKRAPGRAPLQIPSSAYLQDLGIRLMVVGMRTWRMVLSAVKRLLLASNPGFDHRLIESYSLPAAILAVIRKLSDADAQALLQELLSTKCEASPMESDEERLLNEIWQAIIPLERGQRATVSSLIDDYYMGDVKTEPILENVGLKRFEVRDGSFEKFIFFSAGPIKKHLLRDSDFAGLQIEEILKRIPGSRESRQRMGGHLPRGISVPTSQIARLLGVMERPAGQATDPLAAAPESKTAGDGSIF